MGKIERRKRRNGIIAAIAALAATGAITTQSSANIFGKNDKETSETAKKKRYDYHKMTFQEILAAEKGNYQEAWELYEYFGKRRVVFDTDVSDRTVDEAIAKMKVLEELDPGKPIELYIDTYGGGVTAGFRLIDQILTMESPVTTICTGKAASMGAAILMAGDKRQASPHCRVLIHEVSGGSYPEKTGDAEITLDNRRRLEVQLFELISKRTGLSMEDVRALASRDTYYDAKESVTLGFVEEILDSKEIKEYEPGTRAVPAELYPQNRIRSFQP